MSKIMKKTKFKCDVCDKEFVHYSRYLKHIELCHKCARTTYIGDPKFKLAHDLWIKSFSGSRKKIDIKTFVNHREYNFFWKFSEFCLTLQVNDPYEYMQWLIKNKKRSKEWTEEQTLELFIKYTLVNEEPVQAVKRSVSFVTSYNGNYFSSVGAGTILTHLHMGRISPWFILLYNDGMNALLKKSTDEQKEYFNKLVNGVVWNVLMKKNKDDCDKIKTILNQERF